MFHRLQALATHPHPKARAARVQSRRAPRGTTATCAALLLATALAWSPSARALPGVRDAVTRTAAIPCTPDCTLCHNPPPGGAPGKDNMTQPFGVALRDVGKIDVFNPDTTVTAALQNLETAKVDSDQDGVLDVDELRAGDNPNQANASLCGGSKLVPTYGCGAHIAPVPAREGTSVPLMAAALVTLALLANGRGRRQR